MELDDALDGFKLAIKFSIPEEGEKARRPGMEAFTWFQKYTMKSALTLFESWRADQEARIAEHACDDCKPGEDEHEETGETITEEDAKAVVQCLSCGVYFCDYHWIDHLHFSMEHEVPVG